MLNFFLGLIKCLSEGGSFFFERFPICLVAFVKLPFGPKITAFACSQSDRLERFDILVSVFGDNGLEIVLHAVSKRPLGLDGSLLPSRLIP